MTPAPRCRRGRQALKREVEGKYHVPAAEQRLASPRVLLHDDRTLAEHGITDKEALYLAGPGEMFVFVHTEARGTLAKSVKPTYEVEVGILGVLCAVARVE